VIDPTEVVDLALENAASAATSLLLSEATLPKFQGQIDIP
jgi:chaperonin GroEL (HSP60 family)